MSPGPLAPQERPRKKYTARSYSRSTLRPPNRYSARMPRTAVSTASIATPLRPGRPRRSPPRPGRRRRSRSRARNAPPPPASLAERPARDDRGGRAGHDPRRGGRGDEPVLLEVRLEPQQHVGRRLGPHVRVLAELRHLALLLHGNAHHFVLEHEGLPRLLGALLRC